ncbi:MAG: LytTR family DNA-binding domain-containing protein [Chitinophagaceae bacterium]
MKWKCLLVDDEPPAIKILERYIALVDQFEIAGTCSNALQAMEALQKNKIDVLFLDIQLPKLTGISFLKTLTHPPAVIFTTAYKEFASDAYDLDAIDYLVKPFSVERFLKAVNKITQQPNRAEVAPIQAPPSDPGFIYFRSERKMMKVFLDDILYIESIKDYIRIFRVNDGPLLVRQSISTAESMLPQHLFIRVHRSFLVALSKVTAYTNQDIEIGKMEIPIGRQYHGILKSAMDMGK